MGLLILPHQALVLGIERSSLEVMVDSHQQERMISMERIRTSSTLLSMEELAWEMM